MNWNDIPKQTHFGTEETDGVRISGDCWRCCVAAILCMPADQVPHFVDDAIHQRNNEADSDATTQRWLNERGYVLIKVRPYAPSFPGYWLNKTGHSDALQLPVITCGPTIRSKKKHAHHAVVMFKDKLVYDPHPDNAGLLYDAEHYLIVKKWEEVG